jgi:heme exporter protein A
MLAVNDLSYERNQVCLFSGINLRLQKGQALQIKGANGSGKSTLLRILASLLTPTSGSVLWNNLCIHNERDNFQSQINYLGHRNGLKSYLTVKENLYLNATLAGKTIAKTEQVAICQQLGLSALLNKPVNQLSAGQARRLALASIFMHKQALWLLDEPTTALDSQAQHFLKQSLEQHLAQGGIAIYATHQDITLKSDLSTLHLGEKNA